MTRILLRLWLALLLLGGAAVAQAQSFPRFTGLVVDDANVLPPETRAQLTQKLQALQRDTGRQLVVATIGDVQGYPLEDYGNRLLRSWGVGLKNANNGAVLFIAPNNPVGQRGPRLEVGYGLEPILTDAFAATVTKGLMTPMLRDKDIAGAMTAGTDAVIAQLRASPEEAQAKVDAAIAEFDRQHRRQRSGSGGFPVAGVFMLIVFGVIVASVFSGRRRRRRAGPWGRPHRSSDSGFMPIILWSIADEIARNATRGGGGWSSGGGSGWGGGSSDDGSSGGWGGGGFTGGGGGSGGGGGASGDW